MQVNYKGYLDDYVSRVNTTIDSAADDIEVSPRTLHRYISYGASVPDNKVVKMAEVFGQSAAPLIFEHLAHRNAIGVKFLPAPLNNIERTFAAFCYKASEEQQEMMDALNEMCRAVLNGREMDKAEQDQFDNNFMEVFDMFQLCMEVVIAYAKIRGIDSLEERVKEHRCKCVRHGYHVIKTVSTKERPALIAEERAAYQYA